MKTIYTFGNGNAEGRADMKELLGGKGANLAEMNLIGVPVPPGFTITCDVCKIYNEQGREAVVNLIKEDVIKSVHHIESLTGYKFNDPQNPQLVSVRSGAPVSMPGMMDTVLNLGINDEVAETLAKKSGNERFAWDSYRRFVQMYGDVVLGMKPQNKNDIDPFEEIIEAVKTAKGVKFDTELDVDDLKQLVKLFKKAVKENTGKDFPTDAWDQLWGAIYAVFDSWNNERAILYRQMNQIPESYGTAVNVQAMVYGNMGDSSATGVCFSRDAGTGENLFNGEYLINAQGEDVVAGVRTPQQIMTEGSRRWAKLQGISEEERKKKYPSLEETMPECAAQLVEIQARLEDHYKDMQDMEFTIQDGKLWLLQTRNGKRTGAAMVKIAMDLLREGEIDEKTVLKRMEPGKLDELLHPVFDKSAMANAQVMAKGLPASPGAATGKIVFFADDAEEWAQRNEKVIMVRIETSPEDLRGMTVAQGILTARGGMTSHAAVVARGMGICCVSGCGNMDITDNTLITKDKEILHEGDIISIDGTTGNVYKGEVELESASNNTSINELLTMCDAIKNLGVRANADTKKDMEIAKNFGAEGIGLVRTEHMFFEKERIFKFRQMILANDKKTRLQALVSLLPYQEKDFEELYRLNSGLPVVIRYLDPPLHEFLPKEEEEIKELAVSLNTTVADLKLKIDSLKEFNPMMGHRGSRLDITYPEIAVMQTNAVISAACNVKKEGINPVVEIMLPLIMDKKEFIYIKDIVEKEIKRVLAKKGMQIDYQIGAMIEVPRAAILADELASVCDFFSFGTNDLTQLTFGFSRDDAAKFLKDYYNKNILSHDPFMSLDTNGVGTLVKIAAQMSKSIKPNISLGVCGEHAADEKSIEFFDKIGLSYISASAYRVPVAKLAAAKAALANSKDIA